MKKISPKAARKYAQALFESLHLSDLDTTAAALNSFALTLSKSKELLPLINNPAVRLESRVAVVSDIANRIKPGDAALANFVALLVENNRIAGLPEIATVFSRLVTQLKSLLQIEVVSANPIADGERTRLSGALQAQFGPKLVVNWSEDKSLVGGLLVKIGDKVLDSSIMGRYAKLRRELLAVN